jgi:hypothetical protein
MIEQNLAFLYMMQDLNGMMQNEIVKGMAGI